MTIDDQNLWDDPHIKDYLEQELEFANAFANKIVQKHPNWKSQPNWHRYAGSFLGIFVATITDWKKIISPNSEENGLEREQEVSDDSNDSAYEENCTPTSLYQWAYLYLRSIPATFDLVNGEQHDELATRMFRTQHCDAELFGSGSRNAYPPAKDFVLPSLPPALENSKTATSALIHQLPPEILSDIFIRARDGLLYLPIVVSHVDSRFRAIAESTAVLWARININLPLPLASLYLKRSSNALLDIQIDLWNRGIRDNAPWRRLNAFLALVADHRERISSFSMSALEPEPVDDMLRVMMVGLESNYPQLRRLDIGCPIWITGTRPRRYLEPLAFPVVFPPQLQELSLRARRSRDWVAAVPEPLAGLKSLFLANTKLFISDLLIVLAKLPNLETLVIQDCTTEQGPAAAPSTVTLPNLTTLQYVTLSDKSVTSMQQALLSPKITSLKVWYDYDISNWLGRARTLGALLHANPQLESLDLCDCVIEQPGWREAFGEARSLRHLRLLSCESENNNLKALLELAVEEAIGQDFLPHLEHLVLDNVLQLTTKDIRRIITHRPSLRFLELRGWDGSNVADDDVQFIRQSVECFTLETFYKGSGGLEEQEEDEENEEWSSSGTPSEASWLSGDEDISLK